MFNIIKIYACRADQKRKALREAISVKKLELDHLQVPMVVIGGLLVLVICCFAIEVATKAKDWGHRYVCSM